MRLLHTADLHLGRSLHQHSLLDDQRFFIDFLLAELETKKPDVLVIAGDIYDRVVPSAESMALFDYLLMGLSRLETVSLIIGGNHDSPQRLAFAAEILKNHNIHIVTEYQGKLDKLSLFDNRYHFYLLPFFRPSQVRPFFPDREIRNQEDALDAILSELDLDQPGRHILIAHQFFVNRKGQAVLSDSEQLSLGGIDQISTSLLEAFDYVALGHLHQAHYVDRPSIRYSGSPLVYSASELARPKSLSLVEFPDGSEEDVKSPVCISEIPFRGKRPVQKIKGNFQDLIARAAENPCQDYIYLELTDKFTVDDLAGRFRRFYPNLLEIQMPNLLAGTSTDRAEFISRPDKLGIDELFELFYKAETSEDMGDEETSLIKALASGSDQELLVRDATVCGLEDGGGGRVR